MGGISGPQEAHTEEGIGERTQASFTEPGRVGRQKRPEIKGSGVQLLVFSSRGPWNPSHLDTFQGTVKNPKCFTNGRKVDRLLGER